MNIGHLVANLDGGKKGKRILSGVPPPSNKGNNKNDICRKSNQTMG